METTVTASRGKKKYELDFLQSIIDSYPISGEIKDCSRFELGFEDTNYFIEVDNERYVIKIFETPDSPLGSNAFKVEVMDKVFCSGLKTPKVYRNNRGSLITNIAGKQIIVMDFVEGELMAKGIFSDDLIYEVGQQAGKMDTVLASVSGGSKVGQDFSLDLKNFLKRETGVNVLPEHFDKRVFHDIFEAFRKIKAVFDTLPSGIIHHDIVAHNIIARNGHLAAIIDFSDVIHAPYAQNIAATLCQTVFWYNWNPAQAGVFLRGYREFHPFSTLEQFLLYDLTLARYVTLIIGLNNRNIRFGDDANRTLYMKDRYIHLKRLVEFGRQKFDAALTLGN